VTPQDPLRRSAPLRGRPTTAIATGPLAGALALAILGAPPLHAQLATDGSQIWQQGVSGVPGVSAGISSAGSTTFGITGLAGLPAGSGSV